MNIELIVDILDFLSFCLVTPELLGGRIEGARLVVSETRLAVALKRWILLSFLGVNEPNLSNADIDKHWEERWRGGGPPGAGDAIQGAIQIGGAAMFLALDYWLWDWLWHWVRGLIVFMVVAGMVFGSSLLYVAFDRWLRNHRLTFSALWLGINLFVVSRVVSVAFHLKLLGPV
jgi:hypothetical protein